MAIDCLSLVLNIISKYLGYSGEYEKNSLEKLESLKTDLGSADPTAPLIELVNLLNSKTPTSDVWAFLESAASGLNDPFATSSSGVSFVICLVLKVMLRPKKKEIFFCNNWFLNAGSGRRNPFAN